jgi:hypothetical protein
VGTASFRDPTACLRLIQDLPGCLKQAGLTRWRDGIGRSRKGPKAGKETL